MASQLLLVNGVVILIFMSVAFVFAKARRRLDTVDLAWGLGFILVAVSAEAYSPSVRSLMITGLISIWGIRLISHVWQRSVSRGHEDPRYTDMTQKWQAHTWLRAYLSVFIVQAILIWLISLPVDLSINLKLNNTGWLSLIGAIVWAIGFVLESVADRQLAEFLKAKNHPKLMQNGLWHYSRHPNYFGELTQWWGIGIICLQVSYGWLGLLGPLVLSLLIIFVSGLPPIEKRHQDDPLYQDYKRRTSALIPWPPRP